VRFPVPNLCLYSPLSVDQGAVCEKNADSSSRALSQVIPELISLVLGHLTQNHNVVSSCSPRMYGTQFSSSVGGIRSGLVSTPVQGPLSFITLRCSHCQHTNRPLTKRVIFLGQKMCTLVDKVRCVALLDGRWSRHHRGGTYFHRQP
jgi:hypothetical protein